ncbi:MAG: hypothetical protein ACOWWR_04705 [Eubacteriales bacterium]
MKEHIKFLLMLLAVTLSLYLSYVISFYINGIYQLDSYFSSIVADNEVMFYLMGIKIFIFTLFMIYQQGPFQLARGAFGTVSGNLLAIIYLVTMRENTQNYQMLIINMCLDLLLVAAVLFILNATYKRIDFFGENEEVSYEEGTYKDTYEEDIYEGTFHEDKPAGDMLNELKKLTEEIENKSVLLKEINLQIQERQKELEEADHWDDFSGNNTIEVPVRIKIGDKGKCITASSYGNEEIDAVTMNLVKEDGLRKVREREEDLNLRAEQIERKEIIIEKTIANLEQISENIKDRMKLLEDKENDIKKQLELIEEKKAECNSNVENQMYETIFKDPDIFEDEVKLKDSSKEIIIDKNDLLEIRQRIEELSS